MAVLKHPGITTILDSKHARMYESKAHHYVILEATETQFQSREEVLVSNQIITKCFTPEHKALPIVVDIRLRPPINERWFEEGSARLRKRIIESFARVCVLIPTPSVSLQVGRLAREDGFTPGMVYSEDEALDFVFGIHKSSGLFKAKSESRLTTPPPKKS